MKQTEQTVPLTEGLRVARTTRNAFNYWRRAGVLSTEFKETTPGVARDLTRENVLELAMMAMFTAMGTPPKDAQIEIRNRLVPYAGKLPNFMIRRYDDWEWFPVDDMTIEELAGYIPPTFDIDHIDEDDPMLTEKSAPALSIINFAEIKRQVDELFDWAGKETDDGSD